MRLTTHPLPLSAAMILSMAAALTAHNAIAQLDPASIARAQQEGLRSSICPAPGAPASSFEEMFDTERQRMAPAQVFDNLYLLGMRTVTAWALETSDGIILFDAMFHYNVEETVVGSMRQLGLDPAQIRYVIVTHAHNDHFGGARHLQETYGARIVMGAPDWQHMRTWPQLGTPAPLPIDDIAAADGDTITLGDTTVRLVATPGHTPGTLSLIFPVRDGDLTHWVGYWGASSVSFLPPEEIARYMAGADRFMRIDPRIDVPLTNHPAIDGALLRLEALAARSPGETHPFVQGNAGFRAWMTAIHDCAGEVLEQKLRESQP
jgi:metallo-beta-lactamase class B